MADQPRAILTSLDDIGEDETIRLRDCYVEASQEQADRFNDGQPFFIFSLAKAKGWGNVNSSQLSRSLEKARAAERKLARFDDLDPDDAKAAIEEAKSLREELAEAKKGGRAASDWEKQKADLVAAHQGEIAKREERIAKLSGELHENLAIGELRTELEKAGFTKHRKLVEPHFRGLVKYVPSENGSPGRTVVTHEDGTTERLDPSTGEPLTVAQLAAEAAAGDLSILLDGDGASGAGLTGTRSTTSAPQSKDGPLRKKADEMHSLTKDEIDRMAAMGLEVIE